MTQIVLEPEDLADGDVSQTSVQDNNMDFLGKPIAKFTASQQIQIEKR